MALPHVGPASSLGFVYFLSLFISHCRYHPWQTGHINRYSSPGIELRLTTHPYIQFSRSSNFLNQLITLCIKLLLRNFWCFWVQLTDGDLRFKGHLWYHLHHTDSSCAEKVVGRNMWHSLGHFCLSFCSFSLINTLGKNYAWLISSSQRCQSAWHTVYMAINNSLN